MKLSAREGCDFWALDGGMCHDVWVLDSVMKLSARWRNEVWAHNGAMKFRAQERNEFYRTRLQFRLGAWQRD